MHYGEYCVGIIYTFISILYNISMHRDRFKRVIENGGIGSYAFDFEYHAAELGI